MLGQVRRYRSDRHACWLWQVRATVISKLSGRRITRRTILFIRSNLYETFLNAQDKVNAIALISTNASLANTLPYLNSPNRLGKQMSYI